MPNPASSKPYVLHELSPAKDAPLSQHFSAPRYRATTDNQPKWTKTTPKTLHCNECAMLQHETRGRFGPRKKPRYRRTLADGTALLLCALHSQAWHDRDTGFNPDHALFSA